MTALLEYVDLITISVNNQSRDSKINSTSRFFDMNAVIMCSVFMLCSNFGTRITHFN